MTRKNQLMKAKIILKNKKMEKTLSLNSKLWNQLMEKLYKMKMKKNAKNNRI